LSLNISASRKISKIWLVTLEPPMWKVCMPMFSSLALMAWEENEVTDAWSLYEISKLPLRFGRENKTNQSYSNFVLYLKGSFYCNQLKNYCFHFSSLLAKTIFYNVRRILRTYDKKTFTKRSSLVTNLFK